MARRKKQYVSEFAGPRYGQRYDELLKEMESRLLAKSKKRPPLHGTIKNTKGMTLRIFFKQKEVFNVIEYDVSRGYILKEKLDKAGQPFIENDAIATEELFGPVLVSRIK
jgi:hypothetical protein